MLSENKNNVSALKLPGVGPKTIAHLQRLKIYTLEDLLLHLPLRYEDRTQVQAIRNVKVDQPVLIEGFIHALSYPKKSRTKLLIRLHDQTGSIGLRFFHMSPYQSAKLKTGTRLRCYGNAGIGPTGLEMIHPEINILPLDGQLPTDSHLTPVYSTTSGLGQYKIRNLIGTALKVLSQQNLFAEFLPAPVVDQNMLPSLQESIQFIHQPPATTSKEDLAENKTRYQQRIIFEELLAHRLSLLSLKQALKTQKAYKFALAAQEQYHEFIAQLPFQLTKAQKRVLEEIKQDLARDFPMLRLIQGDVGSGKTIVAALTMLHTVQQGAQSVLMAPTELLAEQHYAVFSKWFAAFDINIVLLTSAVKGTKRNQILAAVRDHTANIVIGTHAVFQEDVDYAKLDLIVIDEQHRFGVQQRATLRQKNTSERHPHQLIMTATPIPRTLAMSLYLDLDCSVIDELPPHRVPITTSVIGNYKRTEIVERILKICELGRQVYWVCPLIETSEAIHCEAATDTAETLRRALPNLQVGLIHGRLSVKEKESVMQHFQQGQTHILVATSVIEVGVDVPNASLIIIENAERLGLAQLHQLRGRVGRGATKSYCILLYQEPLTVIARERLSIMRETQDGFKIAQRDLELRGPGEFLGTQQTGELKFHIADILRDHYLFPAVQAAADIMLQDQPQQVENIINRWLAHDYTYSKV